MPTPPTTYNALLYIEPVLDNVFRIPITFVVEDPRFEIDCKVLVFQIVILPVDVLIAVSVPAVRTVVPISVFPDDIIEPGGKLILPPTHRFPPIPTPPATINAPVMVDSEGVVFDINIAWLVDEPLLVIVCNVLVFQIVTLPVLVFIAVSVPAVIIVLDAYKSTVALVKTIAPFA